MSATSFPNDTSSSTISHYNGSNIDNVEGLWCLSNGTSHHMSPSTAHFTQTTSYHCTNSIIIGDGTRLPINHVGKITLPTSMGDVEIPNVLHVLGLFRNLLSIWCLAKDLKSILGFDTNGFNVKVRGGPTIISGSNSARLYLLGTRSKAISLALQASKVSSEVWHNQSWKQFYPRLFCQRKHLWSHFVRFVPPTRRRSFPSPKYIHDGSSIWIATCGPLGTCTCSVKRRLLLLCRDHGWFLSVFMVYSDET